MITEAIRHAGPYTTNGIQTDFTFEFKMFAGDEEYLVVTTRIDGVETTLEYTTDYSVALNADQDNDPGGTVTFVTAPDDVVVLISSAMPIEQPAIFTNNGGFYPRVLNDALDRAAMNAQEQADKLTRSLKVQLGFDGPVMGDPADYAGKQLGVSDDALRIIPVESDPAEIAAQVEIVVEASEAAIEAETGAQTAQTGAENAAAIAAAAQAIVLLTKIQVLSAADAVAAAVALTSGLYETKADGEAGTSPGDTFIVIEDGATTIDWYENVAGVGVLRAQQPTTGLPPFTNATAGALLRSRSSLDNDSEWTTAVDLSKQQSLSLSITDDTKFQLLGTNTANFTATVDGDEMVLASTATGTQHAWLGFAEPVTIGNLYYLDLTFTNLNAGFGGAAIGFTTTPPVPGAAAANLSAEAYGIVYRESGAVGAAAVDGSTAAAGISMGAAASGPVCPEGTRCEIFFAPLTATTGFLLVKVGGAFAFQRIPTGLTPGTFFCAGANFRKTGQEARLAGAVIHLQSLDLPLRIRIDADAPDGGDGSRALPFNHCDQINDLIALDKARRTLRIEGRGVFEGQGIAADLNQWHDIEIGGGVGEYFEIDASEAFAPVWTQIEATDRWYAAHPGYDDNNSTLGGLIEVTSDISDPFGRTGEITVENEVLQNHVAINTDPASALYVSNSIYGSYAVHNLATYVPAGSVVVRARDGLDPNTLDWRWMRRDSALKLRPVDDTLMARARVKLSNIVTSRGYLASLWVERALIEFNDVWVKGANFGYGMELNHSHGEINGGGVIGSGQDNIHWSNGGTAIEAGVELTSRLKGVKLWGGGNRPAGVGDNISNHAPAVHKIICDDCEMIGAGKDGIATAGAFIANNCKMRDAADSGAALTSWPGLTDQVLEINGGEMVGNRRGATVDLSSTPGASGYKMLLNGVHFEDNSEQDVFGSATGAGSDGTVISKLCTVAGDVPPDSATGNRIRMTGTTAHVFATAEPFNEANRTVDIP